MAFRVKDSGTWKTLQVPYVKDGGTWKKCHLIYVKDGGSWKEAHRNTISQYSSDGGTTYSSGTSTYTVAQGVRFLRFLIKGGSGGGAGSMAMSYNYYVNQSEGIVIYKSAASGGTGGTGESKDVTFEVIPGEQFTLSVGGAGSAGSGRGIRARVAYSGNEASWASEWVTINYSPTSSPTAGGNSSVTGPRSISHTATGGGAGGNPTASVSFSYSGGGYRGSFSGSNGSTGSTGGSGGGPSGGSGGSGYSGDISGSSGSAGTAGSIVMYKYS